MDGLLVVNKPTGKTSRDVVNSLNDFFEMKKIGHAGTLDPIAEGVLIVTMGKCTKLNDLFTNHDKEYLTTMKLGLRTDTFDISGKILSEDYVNFTEEEIINAVIGFKGIYNQEVPKYSAVKVNGKKLYEYARENIAIELPKRLVQIKALELMDYSVETFQFKVLVSKGTYIRSLIRDLCYQLETVGSMAALIRTKQGIFNLKEAVDLDDLNDLNSHLISLEEVLKDYEHVEVGEEILAKIKNGCVLERFFKNDRAVITNQGRLIAIYKTYEKDLNKVKPDQMFI